MLFSTYPPETLPKAGDMVSLVYGVPLTVTRRFRDKFGNVMLMVTAADGTEQLTMVEAVHWWPAVGDVGTGLPANYQRWLTCHWDDAKAADNKKAMAKIEKAFKDYNNLQSWLYSDFVIDRINGDIATVSGKRFSGTHAIPLAAILVLRRPSVEAVLGLVAA
jgi:hypothetical protein